MKKTLLFILFSFSALAQNNIQLRLVDGNVGAGIWDGLQPANHESTDIGLNTILQTYGTYSYIGKYGHPLESYYGRIMSVSFTGNPTAFLAALQAYPSVVEEAQISSFDLFTDALRTHLNASGVGIPTGIDNNIVTTNDDGLNQIFVTYNVYYYTQSIPGTTGNLGQYFDVVCNCDNTLLKAALDNYNISESEYVMPEYLLATKPFTNVAPAVYPNPFATTITIEANEKINQYSIYDITGKLLIATDSKVDLDNRTPTLQSGVYVLQLETETGQLSNQKLIKK